MKSKGHWQRVAAYPRDKGIPVHVMRGIRVSEIFTFANGEWQKEIHKKNPSKSVVESTIKKIHNRKRRRWDKLIERAALR